MLILYIALLKLKGPLLDAATDACGLSKNHQWKSETWWSNEQVGKAIREKRARFKAYSALKKGGMTAKVKRAKTAYIDTKHVAKHAVWLAKSEAEKEVFATIFPDGDGIFHIAKQMDRTNQDIVSDNCVHNDVCQLALTPAHSMHLAVYKGKGEALDRGNYYGLKLTDQVMKLHEKVLDSYIHEMVNINEMQLGFVPGGSTTSSIFVVRQLQEKYIAANKLR